MKLGGHVNVGGNVSAFRLLLIVCILHLGVNGKLVARVTRKKSPIVFKSRPKIISLEKGKILTPLQKLPKNVKNWGKLVVAKGFKKFPKVQ